MQTSDIDSWKLIRTYLAPLWFYLLLLLLLLFGSIGLELISPQILRDFIDGVLAHVSTGTLTTLAFTLLAIAIGGQVITVIEAYVATEVEQKATNRLRIALTQHCLNLDLAFHYGHSSGELVERIDGDVATLGNFLSRFVVALLGNIMLLIGILIILFLVDWRVGGVLTLFSIIALATIHFLRLFGLTRWRDERQASADLYGFLEESLDAIEDIRSTGAIPYALRQHSIHSRTVLQKVYRAYISAAFSVQGTLFLFTSGSTIALVLGISLFTAKVISIGTVFMITQYAMLLNSPLERLTFQLQDFQRAIASISRIHDLFA